jgi:hypothetical protein
VRRRSNDPDKPPPGIPLPDLGDFDFRLVPIDGERGKYHPVFAPADPIASEGDISYLQCNPIPDIHRST